MAEMTNAQVALMAAAQITESFRGNEDVVIRDASKFLAWLEGNSK